MMDIETAFSIRFSVFAVMFIFLFYYETISLSFSCVFGLETNICFWQPSPQNKYKAEILKKLEHQRLIEAERKRIAQMRQQQLESEQFLFFEDQLKKQELARGQMRGQDTPVLSEQTDGSGLSCFSTHQNNSLRNVFADQPLKSDGSDFADHSPPVNRALKPAATLSAVQSK